MKVEILSRKLIAPSSPTPKHLQCFKISYLDQLAPPFYVPRVLYYLPNGEEEKLSIEEKIEQLQRSLAETLTLFYPLAGRYIKEKLLVDCNDQGAEFVEAQVSGCLSQLLGDGGGEIRSEWMNELVSEPVESDGTPLALFQFNKFECGGVAIGVCLAHRVADGSTVFNFIDTWAQVSRIGVGNVQFLPSFDLGPFFPQREISLPKIKFGDENDKLTQRRLVFKAAAISNLKAISTSASITMNDSGSLKYQPTRVEVVTAFIWMSLIKLDQAKHGRLRPSILSIPINMRKKTNLPVPESYCGNFVGRAVPKFFPDEDHKGTKLQLHDFAATVHDAIRSSIANFAKASTPDDIMSLVNHANKELIAGMGDPEVNCCFCTSWCRFPKYEADFGWGKPSRVTSDRSKMRNVVTLLDAKDGDGIEAWVILDQSMLHLFEQDSEIIPFLG